LHLRSGESGYYARQNNQAKKFEPVILPTKIGCEVGASPLSTTTMTAGSTCRCRGTKICKGEVRLFRNLGPDGFKDVTSDVGLDKIALKNRARFITGGLRRRWRQTDLLITQNHGPAVLLRNEGGNKNTGCG